MPVKRGGGKPRSPATTGTGRTRRRLPKGESMTELLRTNDPIRLSWLVALLAGEGIEAFVLDTHTSIVEGSIGAIPRRLVVREEDAARARHVLAEAGEAGR